MLLIIREMKETVIKIIKIGMTLTTLMKIEVRLIIIVSVDANVNSNRSDR